MSEPASGLSVLAAAARNTRKTTHLRYDPRTLRRILYRMKASAPHSKLYTIRIPPDGSGFKVSYKRRFVEEVNEENEGTTVVRSINKYVIGRPDIQGGRYSTKLNFIDIVTTGDEDTYWRYNPSVTGFTVDPLLAFFNGGAPHTAAAIVTVKEDPNTNGSAFSMRKRSTRRRTRKAARA